MVNMYSVMLCPKSLQHLDLLFSIKKQLAKLLHLGLHNRTAAVRRPHYRISAKVDLSAC